MCYKELPAGYSLAEVIDLQSNRRQFWAVNGLALALAAVLAVAGVLLVPFSSLAGTPLWELFAALGTMLAGIVLYVILHELTHGVFLYAFTRVRPKFGFVGWAAYCGNTAYCDKPRYLIVAVAPLILWGVVFAALNVVLCTGVWFWAIWALQIVNVSGAAGDLFVFFRLITRPKHILVNDTGLKMCVYALLPDGGADGAAGAADEKADEKKENV